MINISELHDKLEKISGATKVLIIGKQIDTIGEKFGLEVMQALNDKCSQWKIDENIDYSLYGTPLEATTEKFAKKLKERFGIIDDIEEE